MIDRDQSPLNTNVQITNAGTEQKLLRHVLYFVSHPHTWYDDMVVITNDDDVCCHLKRLYHAFCDFLILYSGMMLKIYAKHGQSSKTPGFNPL